MPAFDDSRFFFTRSRRCDDIFALMQDLSELIRWRARVTPDVVALWFEGRQTSYRELDRLSSQVANALIDRGVKPGDRVCVLDQNHDMLFELSFGIRANIWRGSELPG